MGASLEKSTTIKNKRPKFPFFMGENKKNYKIIENHPFAKIYKKFYS
jgi:hypothetical protein